ncbi:MAG: TIGR03435 family protein [Acidobacteriia bacterium]|nr:TIGR03435 family protein [Terriglobia bacterium]
MGRAVSCWSGAVFLAAAAFGQPVPAPATFDVASIRAAQTPQGPGLTALRETIEPAAGSLTMRNVTLATCIRWAYNLKVYELSGPPWLADERFDIAAKAAAPVAPDQLRPMLQALLADRFHLAAHRQTKELPAYALVVGKNGTKLHPAEGAGAGSMTGAALVFQGHKMPLSRLAEILSSALKVPVLEMTGLEGHYDFVLDLRPYILQRQPGDPPLDLLSIAITALQDELGLKLESRKADLEVLVVDRVEKTPTEN